MLAGGNVATLLTQPICSDDNADLGNVLTRKGIAKDTKMISLHKAFKGLPSTYENNRVFQGRKAQIKTPTDARINSTSEFHKAELPPICQRNQRNNEQQTRPLTPLILNSTSSKQCNLPKKYRLINLDLVPLVEIGNGVSNVMINRRPSTSMTDSSYSGISRSSRNSKVKNCNERQIIDNGFRPKGLKEKCLTNTNLTAQNRNLITEKNVDKKIDSGRNSLQKRTLPLESDSKTTQNITSNLENISRPLERSAVRRGSLESSDETDSEEESLNDSKNIMILHWLQTVEKSKDISSQGDLLPCITEGKLA